MPGATKAPGMVVMELSLLGRAPHSENEAQPASAQMVISGIPSKSFPNSSATFGLLMNF